MRIGYSKIGRSWNLDPVKGTATGGDADVARALHLLAAARPHDTFVLVGRNSGENPQKVGYPENVVNPWEGVKLPVGKPGETRQQTDDRIWNAVKHIFDDIDQHIIWAGQHGTTNTCTPMVEDRSQLTNPQISFVNYGSYLVHGLNEFRDTHPDREEIWLCPDPRNYLKARDVKWPGHHPVIGQFNMTRDGKHERYDDPRSPTELGFTGTWDPKSDRHVWIARHSYVYGALEMTAIPGPNVVSPRNEWKDRLPFGMLVNENRAYVAQDRLSILQSWVLRNYPDAEVFGVWSDASKAALKRPDIAPVKYSEVGRTLNRWKSTLTTPASGTGWATAKPWECFKFGTVCFFHPGYDTQNHILRDAPKDLQEWLRVKSVADLKARVDLLNEDHYSWEWLIDRQHEYYLKKYAETQGGIRMIMERLEA